MGDRSKIEWTSSTWNPIRGCSRVSEGCRHCYAERTAWRHRGGAYSGLVKIVNLEPRWTGEVRFIPELLDEPLRWRTPRRVFVNSMSDCWHEKVHPDWLLAIFAMMAACQRHTFQILTKRPERMAAWFDWFREKAAEVGGHDLLFAEVTGRCVEPTLWPLPNVWLGVSVEDQATADARIPWLLRTPAAVRWVSYEPALGPVDFTRFLCDAPRPTASPEADHPGKTSQVRGSAFLSWLVVGGESGPGARPLELAWARQTIAQCRAAGVPVFVKQLGARPVGEWGPDPPTYHLTDSRYSPPRDTVELSRYKNGVWRLTDRKGGAMDEWPLDLRVREFPR